MAAKKRRPAGGKNPTQRRATPADKDASGEAKARRVAKAEAAAVAATAWRRRLLCPQPDVDALARFVRTYVNKGPEKQPA